jgi:hypothetical protein
VSAISQQTAGKVLKGVYSAGIAFCASLGAVLVGNEPLSGVTAGQWVLIAGASLAAFGGTFGLASWSGPSTHTSPPAEGGSG